MIQDKSVEASYSKSITVVKHQFEVLQKIAKKTEQPTVQFSFIELNQWILLLLLNFICLGFIIFVCSLIY